MSAKETKLTDPFYLMCPDLDAAARNRRRIKAGFGIEWWLWYEAVLQTLPRGRPMPSYIPLGEMPLVSGKTLRATEKPFSEMSYLTPQKGGVVQYWELS